MQYQLFENPIQTKYYELSFMISSIGRIKSYVRRQKNLVSAMVGHFRSMNYPAHISLGKTLEYEDDVKKVLDNAKMCFGTFNSFSIYFNGFAIFPESNTIFANIVDSENIISIFNRLFIGKPPKPHMTIAEGLSDEQFFHAWNHFQNKEYKDRYICDHILVLRREYGSKGRWEQFDKIPFL